MKYSTNNQIDLFIGIAQTTIAFTDWNCITHQFKPRQEITAEQCIKRFVIKNSLELMCKLLKQREKAFKYASKFDFNYKTKQYHIEILNDELVQLSLYDERHWEKFIVTVAEKILPELVAIQPHAESRFYYRYKLNINNLTSFFQKELKRIK